MNAEFIARYAKHTSYQRMIRLGDMQGAVGYHSEISSFQNTQTKNGRTSGRFAVWDLRIDYRRRKRRG